MSDSEKQARSQRMRELAAKSHASPKRQMRSMKVSREVEIDWVAENLNSKKQPQMRDAPSARAWKMYLWASGSAKAADVFWTRHYLMLATKEKAKEVKGFTDDERRGMRFFAQVERNMAKRKRNGKPESADTGIGCSVPAIEVVPTA